MAKMRKLLIITQKVDLRDPILGFFHRWLEEFAKNVEKLTVICLEKGEFDLPENVKVLSLGKESGRSRIKYLWRFYKYIWKERGNYDAVFVHMNPEYVILGWADWKILGKEIALWYVHKAVNWRLWLAEKFADKIFTASRESFRLPSQKVEVVGHGIDIDKFQITGRNPQNSKLTIITAGRIAPVKNLETLIDGFVILSVQDGSAFGGQNSKIDFSARGGPASGWELKIAGGPIIASDKIYFEKLKSMVSQKNLQDRVFFEGAIPYSKIQDFYHSGDIFVNLSETGSIDKAVLEAMACGLSVVTSNEAFRDILPSQYFLDNKTAETLAEKIKKLSLESRPNFELRDIVVKNHSLELLIKKIIMF